MVYHFLIAPAGLALLLAVWLAAERLAAAARTGAWSEAQGAPACAACAPACGACCQPGTEPRAARGLPSGSKGPCAPSHAKEDIP